MKPLLYLALASCAVLIGCSNPIDRVGTQSCPGDPVAEQGYYAGTSQYPVRCGPQAVLPYY